MVLGIVMLGGTGCIKKLFPDYSMFLTTDKVEHDALLGNTTSVDPNRGFYGEIEAAYNTPCCKATSWGGTTSSSGLAVRDNAAVPGVWWFQETNGACANQVLYHAKAVGGGYVKMVCHINTGYNNSQYTAMYTDGAGYDENSDLVEDPNDLGTDSLYGDDQMSPRDAIHSPNGDYSLVFQSNGDLVLYYMGSQATWSSNTDGSGAAHAIMQQDGNFVLYDGGWSPVWDTGTAGNSGAHICVQNDGNVVVYSNTTVALWALW
jgi:hypothetical protein